MFSHIGPWPRQLSLESIRGRLALVLAMAFLPAGLTAFQAGLSSLSARNAAVQVERSADVLNSLNIARDHVTMLREGVRTLAAGNELLVDDRGRCRDGLPLLDGEARTVRFVLDERGQVLCASEPGAAGRKSSLNALIAVSRLSGNVVVGFVDGANFSTSPALAAVAPMEAASGRPDGFVGAARPVSLLLEEARMRESDGFVALVSREGEMLAGSGVTPKGPDADAVRAQFRETPASNLGAAFKVGRKWAVAMPLHEGSQLFLVQAWTPAPLAGVGLLGAAWALFSPIVLWLGAVGATWLAVEYLVARPLLIVEDLARVYARGDDGESGEARLHGAPIEISNLRRTLAAMAKTLRGREARLAVALQEERALLLEVNHRVKNNLQMVASILSIQSRGAADQAEARGLARAQDRVQLLALAHAHIYASGEVRDIALDQLASEIVRAMSATRGGAVRLDMSLSPVRATADRAVPLAFLIGESVLSLLDIPQDGGKIDAVRISLRPSADRGFVLELDADGEGGQPSATSQRLIGAFARQIGATITYDEARPLYVCIVSAASGASDEERKIRGDVVSPGADLGRKSMNWEQIEGKWDQFKGNVRQQWGKLTDDDLERARGQRDELVGRIKERYGVEKEDAERQVDDWLKTFV